MAEKEQIARKILELVRSGNHPYFQLRHNGNKLRYFCTLCLQQCYGDDDLLAHLDGKIHKERKSAAQLSLLGPKPWPFNDGITFFDFDTSTESDKNSDESVQSNDQPCSIDGDSTLVIPNLSIGGETSDVKVREIGWGKIAARFLEKDNTLNGIKRIWCEWLGKQNDGPQDAVEVQEHDFAVVVFSYSYDLGRSGSMTEPENERESCQKGKTSLLTNKAARKELRQKELRASEKLCAICYQKMLPGKDVAALLNLKNGRLVCTQSHITGAFHVFHTSCLIHWIIACEHEIITNHLVPPNVKPKENDIKTLFCPDCLGTGMSIGDRVMNPKFNFSQLFKLKIMACDARKEWFRSPEVLQNCSIGFHFPSQYEEIFEEKVEPTKLLHFYRADDQSGAYEETLHIVC